MIRFLRGLYLISFLFCSLPVLAAFEDVSATCRTGTTACSANELKTLEQEKNLSQSDKDSISTKTQLIKACAALPNPSSTPACGMYSQAVTEVKAAQDKINRVKDVVGTATFGDTLAKSIDAVQTGITNYVKEKSQAIASTDLPMKLLGGLSIIMFSWLGFKVMLEKGAVTDVMPDIISGLFTVGLAYTLLQPEFYTLFIGGVDPNTTTGLVGGMNWLANLMMPGTVSSSVSGITMAGDGHLTDLLSIYAASAFSTLSDINTAHGDSTGILDYLKNGQAWMSLLLTLAAMIIVILTTVLAFVAFMGIFISVALALLFGPIFIPFLVLEKTSFLFDGWVKFTVISSLAKVIATAFLGFGLSALAAVKALGAGATALQTAGSIPGIIAVAMVLWLIASLLVEAPSIAQSIVSGGNMSFGKFGGRMLNKGGQLSDSIRGTTAGKGLQAGGKNSATSTAYRLGSKMRSGNLGQKTHITQK